MVGTRQGGQGDKKTREENRTELGSVKLTSKSRNALFFVLTLPCLLVYLSSLSYLNPNLKKPTLVSWGRVPQLNQICCDRAAFNQPLKTLLGTSYSASRSSIYTLFVRTSHRDSASGTGVVNRPERPAIHRLSQVTEVPLMLAMAATVPHPVVSLPYSDVDDRPGTTDEHINKCNVIQLKPIYVQPSELLRKM